MTDREWLKSKGICTNCRKARAAKGRTLCLDCLDDMKYRAEITRSEASRAQRRAYIKRKRDICVALGICRECMCREATEGLKCIKCKTKERIKSDTNSKKMLYRNIGACTLCGDTRVDGYKVCQRCLDKCRSIARNRRKADNSNHYWRVMQSREVRYVKDYVKNVVNKN